MSEIIFDPMDSSTAIIGSAAVGDYGMQVGASTLTNVHPDYLCAGRACVIHAPSDHRMRTWNLNWRSDTGVMERLCPHGVGHPDPDDLAYHVSQGRSFMGVHGCDGCCAPPE